MAFTPGGTGRFHQSSKSQVLAPIDQIDKHPYTRPRAWSFRQFDRKSAIVPTEILPLRWSHAGRKKTMDVSVIKGLKVTLREVH
jgi:hypothetical protein